MNPSYSSYWYYTPDKAYQASDPLLYTRAYTDVLGPAAGALIGSLLFPGFGALAGGWVGQKIVDQLKGTPTGNSSIATQLGHVLDTLSNVDPQMLEALAPFVAEAVGVLVKSDNLRKVLNAPLN